MPRSAKMNRVRAIEYSIRKRKISRAFRSWQDTQISTPYRAARMRRCFAVFVDDFEKERAARRVLARIVWLRKQPRDYVVI